jgi:nicotinamidase-related amidase
MRTALLLIDLQNDYYPDGSFPLWNTENTTNAIESAIAAATERGDLIVHVQHIADPSQGLAPFFNEGTPGEAIHPRILAAAPEAPVIIKHYADSFEQTGLKNLLTEHSVTRVRVCGMMTQNCVTHTAISKAAETYDTAILTDCCTTVSEMIHLIALHAVSTRMALTTATEEYA